MKEHILSYMKNIGINENEVKTFGEIYDESVKEDVQKSLPDAVKDYNASKLSEHNRRQAEIAEMAKKINIT